jgi:hypothetical protein
MPRGSAAKPLVTNFHGRDFNSPNDVVVASDGAIWFTDPCYANEQDFRHRPKLPNQVYRFDPVTGDIRVVADGFGRPNGICFSPDEKIVYITDTDHIHGDGIKDETRLVLQCYTRKSLTETIGPQQSTLSTLPFIRARHSLQTGDYLRTQMTVGRMVLNVIFAGTFIRGAEMAYMSGMLEGHSLAKFLCLEELQTSASAGMARCFCVQSRDSGGCSWHILRKGRC